jgi:hypothetical protein
LRFVFYCGLLCTSLLLNIPPAYADASPKKGLVTLLFGPYVHHYGGTNAEDNSFPWFVGLEWESASRWEVGAAYFRNSHYQPSGYVYGGKSWKIYGCEDSHLFFKLTAGALLGYVKPYDNVIPINLNGIGLGVIPAIGYKYKRASTQFVILWNQGFMVTVGYDIWR